MKIWMTRLITVLVTLLLVGCDQITKQFAFVYLPKDQMDSYFNDLLRVGYRENMGAFLGLGNSLSEETRFWLFVVIIGSLLFGLLCYLITSKKQPFSSIFALTFVFAGGVSNFYDRIVNDGAVVDFLNIGVGTLRTGIFNIADVAIMFGVLVLLLAQFKSKPNTFY